MSQKRTKKSKVITFYSFKGGVGRSMALVNAATLLSSWGYKVLMVDWDLEAPGIENFFTPYTRTLDTSKQLGVLDLLHDLQESKKSKWKDYVYSFSTKISKTPLHLITSGRAHEGYTDKLRAFNVGAFYDEHQGGYSLENLRNEWLEAYDFVLIDSRTGVTDFGGICTIQMPDILVMLLTPTEQGLNGTIRIAKRSEQARRSLPFDREKLLVFPVPSRIDSTNEFEQSQRWVKRFTKEFEPFFDDWLPAGISQEDFLQRVKIPYIPYFSFGEKLPVIEQGMSDTAGLGYAYENLAMLIGSNLDNAGVFLEGRSNYLEEISGEAAKNGSADSQKISIYISCVQEDLYTCHLLEKKIKNIGKGYGISVIYRDDEMHIGYSKSEILSKQIGESDIIIVWHSSSYANKMFMENAPFPAGRNDIEIEIINRYSTKMIIPVFLIPPSLGGIYDQLTPDFIADRFGIEFSDKKSLTSDNIIDTVSEKIMPIIANVYKQKISYK